MATRQRNRCNAVIFFPTISAPPRRIGAALTDSAAQCEYCTALLVVHRGNECSPDGLVCDKHPVEGSQCVKKKNQQQNKKNPTKNVRTTSQEKSLSQQRSSIVSTFSRCISSFPSHPLCSLTAAEVLPRAVRRSTGVLPGCCAASLSAL